MLTHEDRLIAREFTTELTLQEQRVFGWLVEGLQYRAVASVLGIPVNEARNIARACDRKRERFQLLYDTGRLCGYRAVTIQALRDGESTSEELAERAFAHLESCIHCRQQHKTNAKRLRRSFREQSAAFLPPVLIGGLGRLTPLGIREDCCCIASGSTLPRPGRQAYANAPQRCSQEAASARKSLWGS